MRMNKQSVRDDAVLVTEDFTSHSSGTTYGIITFSVHPFRMTESHKHRSEETWIVRSGKGHAIIGSQNVVLDVGARVIVPANQEHMIVNDYDMPLVILSFWWKEGE